MKISIKVIDVENNVRNIHLERTFAHLEVHNISS